MSASIFVECPWRAASVAAAGWGGVCFGVAGLPLILTAPLRAEVVELASSSPAGYFSIELNGASDNPVALPIYRSVAARAKVTAVEPSRLVCAAARFAPTRFSTGSDGTMRDAFQVEFTSGKLKGVSYRILDNSETALVLDTEGDDLTAHPLGSLVFGDTIRIRPLWTVSSVFGASEEEVVLEKQPNPFIIRDSVLLYDQGRIGINKAPAREFFYVAGQGWWARGGGPTDMGEQSLRSGEPFLVRRKNAGSLSVAVVGVTLREQSILFVAGASSTVPNDSYVSLAHPEAVSLNESGLANSTVPAQSVVQASPNSTSRTDSLLEWAKGQTGLNRAPSRIYYYLAGEGWRQAGSSSPTIGSEVFLEPGRAYIIRKSAGNAGKDWVQPLPSIE